MAAEDRNSEERDANAPPPAQPQAAQPISITFEDVNRNEVQFKLKTTTKLGKAMDAYAAKQQLPATTFRFLFDGERVQNDNTPGDLDMEDGDKIEVYTEQLGG